ncbi:MAG TPA: c-type cytochrome [Gemmatales bacterium]|nr:c-type cytochrome [Gemmatales bacterium]
MRWLPVLLTLLTIASPALAQKEYGFDNRKPSGQPYLSPQETVSRMKVPPCFSVKLFAAEPLMTNPIAMTIDEKGRVWIVESFEYPKRTGKGLAPRDRIVILEDTDGDGIADKRTVFAEGKDFPVTKERAEKGLGAFDMASGLEVGNGGCYVGAPPYLWHIKGKDKAESFEIVASGFGSQDTHETLNTFTWGPDGWLYGLHGVFTVSKVIPGEPGAAAPGVKAGGEPIDLDAGVWRYHPRSKKFEIFAEGTSNPWGMDFNSQGECFICACVIPHLYHMVPGGIYIKQGGKPSHNPYAYGAIKEICDHTFHKESGWAHAGLLCLDVPHMPKEFQNSVIFGSIHGCSIKQNILKPNGSTFTASRGDDFLVSGDKNFRPIQIRWAPDGSILVSDWHDQNPCHQTNPDDWDYERGRIYRIVPPVKLDSSKTEGNPFWQKAGIQRDPGFRAYDLNNKVTVTDIRHRITSEYTQSFGSRISNEISPINLREHASALINEAGKRESVTTLQQLANHRLVKNDPLIPFLLWLATERELTFHRDAVLSWMEKDATGNEVIANHLLARTMRRLAATGKADDLSACLKLIQASQDNAVCHIALSGLAEAMKGRKVKGIDQWSDLAAQLVRRNNTEITRLVRTLSSSFYDATAVPHHIATLTKPSPDPKERIDAIEDLAFMQAGEGLPLIIKTLHADPDETVRLVAARSLVAYEQPTLAKDVLTNWKNYPQKVRYELINTLRSRRPWAKTLLEAVGNKTVDRSEMHNNVALAIRQFKDKDLNDLLDKHYGVFRDTPPDIDALLAKLRKEVPAKPGDPVNGKAVFAKHCMQCHKFDGQGHDVGPNLDGAERSREYLLVNIVDPNRVVGTPYFIRTIVLKNGKVVTGILAEEDGTTIRLKRENAVIEVIVKADIEDQSTSTKSLMPEGLPNNMTIQELRDLIRYLDPTSKK